MKRIVCVAVATGLLAALGTAPGAGAFPVLTGGLPGAEWSEYQYQRQSLTLEGVGGERMRCGSFFTQYRVDSATQIDLGIEGVGCTSSREPCFTGTHEVGNIGFQLRGTLGYIDPSKRKVGLLLKGAGEPEYPEALARMFCPSFGGASTWGGGDEMYPSGSVVAAVGPVDRVTESLQLTFKQHHGVPAVLGLFAGLPAMLYMADPVTDENPPMGLALKATLKLPGALQVSG